MRLEELQPNAAVQGLRPDETIAVVSVKWHSSNALTLIYRDASDRINNKALYPRDETARETPPSTSH